MNGKFFYSLGGVLPHHLASQVKELYASALLQNLALAMLLLFEPIYLWRQGFSVAVILWFFLGVYVAYLFVMPLGAKFATRFGYEHSMLVSTFAQVAYYAALYLIAYDWRWAVPAAGLYAAQKALYWPAYHADFARYSDPTEEGKEVSGMTVGLSLVYVAGPLLAGAILTLTGSWALLFGFGCVIILLSNWPLMRTAEQFTPREFPYADTYRRLLDPDNRRALLGYMGFGEELVVLVLWPIFISTVVTAYVEIGAVAAGATLITALATLYIGKLTDEHNKHSVLKFSTLLYAFGWLMRIFVQNPVGVFLLDSWSRLTKNIVAVPLTAITYERAKARSVMDTVVAFEMSLVVGKIVAIAVLLAVFTVIGSMTLAATWNTAWVVAALMTLLYVLV